jgi:hypothetical protein
MVFIVILNSSTGIKIFGSYEPIKVSGGQSAQRSAMRMLTLSKTPTNSHGCEYTATRRSDNPVEMTVIVLCTVCVAGAQHNQSGALDPFLSVCQLCILLDQAGIRDHARYPALFIATGR